MDEKKVIEVSRECKWCGKYFVPARYNQVYCCPNHQLAYREYKRLHTTDIVLKPKKHMRDSMKEISAIARKAREEGISYGKYVAKYGL